MRVEIRAAAPEEMDEFARVLSYAFVEPAPDAEDAQPPTVLPEWTTCAFVDERLAVASAAYPFAMRLNGERIGAAGVTCVAAYPEFRRQGLLRRAMEQGLQEQRERGQSVAILWASFAAIYQRFGYGLASTSPSYRFDPRRVAFREEWPRVGSVGLVRSEEALDTIKPLYIAYAGPRNLMLHRAPAYWQNGVLGAVGSLPAPYVAVYRDASGEPRGYLVYRVRNEETDEPGPTQVMTVRDFVALDIDAYRGLWNYIRSHDLVREVSMAVSPDDPAPTLVLEPRELRTRVSDGLWLRVVDVERSLDERRYSAPGSVVLEVEDDLCSWNTGRFLLESATDGTRIERTRKSADLALPVRSLASLLTGQANASELERAGLLAAHDRSALPGANRLFATDFPPFCPDGF